MENEYMKIAIDEAKAALKEGEVPVGAVIVKDKKVIAVAHNLRETNKMATAHAELLAIEKACSELGTWRLDDCSLYVTLEPCLMCAGAIINSRIKSVYFGSYDRDAGAFGTALTVHSPVISLPEIYGGIMEDECDKILKDFFKDLREKSV